MLDCRLKMFKNDRLRRCCAPSTSSISHHQSHLPALSTSSINNLTSHLPHSALTLIELLVVIVILTTLVGGVIPILSPNNDVRKIQAAARGLQSYITLVQTQAARTGRPQGIAFRESSAGTGVALEVFGLEVPPPFAGFSTESRVEVKLKETIIPSLPPPFVYNPSGSTSFLYHPRFNDFPLYRMELKLADGFGAFDPLPPHTFRIGDTINVGGNQFLIVDTPFNVANLYPSTPVPDEIQFIGSAASPVNHVSIIECVWINNSGQVAPQGLKRYQINRQPTNSTAAPYQLPAGIVIDMQASVAEGSGSVLLANPRFPVAASLSTDRSALTTPPSIPTDRVGIMFSPTGAVSSVIFNETELTSVSRIVLLLGRNENGGIDPTMATYPWVVSNPNDKLEVEQKQETINWLNLDSRLLSIVTSSGRTVVSKPAFVNLGAGTDEDNDGDTIDIDADDQLEAAHVFAHEMTTAK